MTFAQDMAKFRNHLQRDAKRAHGAIGVKILGDIIEATPIDLESVDIFGRHREPGNLKRNWFTAVGDVAVTGVQSNPFNQMAQVVFGASPDATITMANGAPYAELIEYGIEGAPNTRPPPTWINNYPSGINFQMPGGWVRVTIGNFNQSAVDDLLHG